MSHTPKKQLFFTLSFFILFIMSASRAAYDDRDLSDAMAAVKLARGMREQRALDALERAALAAERAEDQRRQRRRAKARAEEEAFQREDEAYLRATAILAVCRGLKFPFTAKMNAFAYQDYSGPLAEDVCAEFKEGHLEKCQKGVSSLLESLQVSGVHLSPKTRARAQKFLSEGDWWEGQEFFQALKEDPNYQGGRSTCPQERPHHHREEDRRHHSSGHRGHTDARPATAGSDLPDLANYTADFLTEVRDRVRDEIRRTGSSRLSPTEQRFKKLIGEGSKDLIVYQLALQIAEDRDFLQDMIERGTGVWADDSY